MKKFSSSIFSAFKLLAVGMWIAASAMATPAMAQSRDCLRNINGETVCPPPRSVCMQERDNPTIKCSPAEGGITADRYGKAVCGVGSCVTTMGGDPFCSKAAGGAAAISLHGEAVCTNGCEPAKASLCTVPVK